MSEVPNLTKFPVHITRGLGSNFLWQRHDKFYIISGFVDDVTFHIMGPMARHCTKISQKIHRG